MRPSSSRSTANQSASAGNEHVAERVERVLDRERSGQCVARLGA